jgi:hypothetical protein
MKTVRRLYFYAVALISLEVVLWGVIGLLRTVVDDLSIGAGNALAQALALVLVGVPIFLVHWLWAQNAAAKDEEEKTASLRGVFLYAALLGTLVPVVQNLLALINRLILQVSSISRDRALLGANQTPADNLIAILMNLLVAAYFWSVLQKEWRTLPDTENFKDVRRLYRYIWMLYSLLMTIFGAQQLIRFIFYVPTRVVGIVQQAVLVNSLALLLVGLPIWFYIWKICQEALSDPAEKGSVLRLGVLYLLALGGVIAVLASAGTFLFQVLNQLMGAGMSWPDFVKNIGGPISVGVPLGAVWGYYGFWLNRHIEAVAEGPQREALKRPYQYILSLIGLAAAFIGVTLLIRVIIDLGLGRQFVGDNFMRQRTASSLATVLVGLPLWLSTWRPAERRAREASEPGDQARRSVVRRAYLYLVLFASVIGGMVAAVTLVFRLLSALLTGDNTGDFANVVLNSLQMLVLFVIVLVYHLGALRRDGASRAETTAPPMGDYSVLVIDPGQGGFAERARMALGKQGKRILVSVMADSGQIPADAPYQAVILPVSAAMHPPEGLKAWLEDFGGRQIILPDEAGGALLAGDAREAARMTQQLAGGHEVVSGARVTQPGWIIVVYVFAALFALQLLFGLLMLGISTIVRF